MPRPRHPDPRVHRQKVGERIRMEREHFDLSQEDLASAIGITQQELSKIESGEKPLPVDVLSRLCRAFAREHALRIRDQILNIDHDLIAAA